MIECIVRLECDTCGRVQTATFDKLHGPVDVPVIIAACRWGQFLAGPVLCPECLQNENGEVDRSTRIQLAALPCPPSRNGHHPEIPRVYRKPPKYGITDEEIMKAANEYPMKKDAAKALDMSYNHFLLRVKKLARNGVAVLALALVGCTTPGSPAKREPPTFPPMPQAIEARHSVPRAPLSVAPSSIALGEFVDVPDGIWRVERSQDLEEWEEVFRFEMPKRYSYSETRLRLLYEFGVNWEEEERLSKAFYRLRKVE